MTPDRVAGASMRLGPKVFVIDDDLGQCQRVVQILSAHRMRVETFASAEAFLDVVDPRNRGCVLADVRLPRMDGLALQSELTRRDSTLPVVFITAHAEVSLAVEAFKRGAFDFIEKPFGNERLLECVEEAVKEDRRRRRKRARKRVIKQRMARLTPRERQVMDLVVEGQTSRAIARNLGLAEKTVELHRSHVNKKMGARNAVDLVRMVVESDTGKRVYVKTDSRGGESDRERLLFHRSFGRRMGSRSH